jgi:peptidoglycan hydrolase-like protein with peptidoglycan-binding domain
VPRGDFAWDRRCRSSIERSQARRHAAGEARKRRIRIRGGGLSVALVALAVGVTGAGVAVGQTSGSSGRAAGLLSKGSSGPGVAGVQRALGLRATGHFGSATDRGVRAFQRRRGLLVDGIVGPQTRAALGLGPSAATAAGSRSATTTQATTAAGSGSGSPDLQRISQCESGGNPHAVSAGGQYRGKYQFSYQTWRSVGGRGDPAAASEAEQDRRAAALYRRGGTGSWPVCGR